MKQKYVSPSGVVVALAVLLGVLILDWTVFINPINADPSSTVSSVESTQLNQTAWTTIDFEGVGDLLPVGRQGLAQFAWVWRGAVDSDDGGCCGIANEPSPDTVAMMWDSPITPADSLIAFDEPVEAIFFHYTLDTSYGTPTVKFLDELGNEIGHRPLNTCGAVGCGNACVGDPTGDLCDFQYFEFIAEPGRGISTIQFEMADWVFGRFALDDFTYFEIHPIFIDGFEIGGTDLWSVSVGAVPTPTPTPTQTSTPTPTRTVGPHDTPTPTPTPTFTPKPAHCAFVHVEDLTRLGTDRVYIYSVRNSSDYPLRFTRMVLSWQKIHPDQVFDSARFVDIALIREEDDPDPPTTQDIEIDFTPGQSSRFMARWSGWDHASLPLSDDIEVSFEFVFPVNGQTCTVTRTLNRQGSTAPTATPTR